MHTSAVPSVQEGSEQWSVLVSFPFKFWHSLLFLFCFFWVHPNNLHFFVGFQNMFRLDIETNVLIPHRKSNLSYSPYVHVTISTLFILYLCVIFCRFRYLDFLGLSPRPECLQSPKLKGNRCYFIFKARGHREANGLFDKLYSLKLLFRGHQWACTLL